MTVPEDGLVRTSLRLFNDQRCRSPYTLKSQCDSKEALLSLYLPRSRVINCMLVALERGFFLGHSDFRTHEIDSPDPSAHARLLESFVRPFLIVSESTKVDRFVGLVRVCAAQGLCCFASIFERAQFSLAGRGLRVT